jgi:hypothetical protein
LRPTEHKGTSNAQKTHAKNVKAGPQEAFATVEIEAAIPIQATTVGIRYSTGFGLFEFLA